MTRLLLPILLVSVIVGAGCAGGVQAQTAPAGGDDSEARTAGEEDARIERRLAHMRARLELTDDQVELLRPVLEDRRARQEELRRSFHEELEGILTPAQLAQLEEMRARRRGRFGRHGRRGRGRRGRHGPPDPSRMLSRMAEHLELTEAQRESIRPILEAAHARHAELRGLPRAERRAAFRTIRRQTKAAIEEVLTEEQRAELEEHFRRRRERRRFHR